MSLFGAWHPRNWTRNRAPAASSDVFFEAAPVSGLDELQVRLNQWSQIWSQEIEPGVHTEAQKLVTERLAHWMERCFGQHVQKTLRTQSGQISLASSTPIFTAFLGRRATRELSRRVLQDI